MRIPRLCLVLLALLLAPPPAAAQTPGGWLDSFNQAMFSVNRYLGDTADAAIALVPAALIPPDSAINAVQNLLANTINEPLTVIGHAIAGNWELAGRSAQRFGINIAFGWGGLVDAATERGVTVPRLDIGLAFCSRGVGGGPYIVLPIVGPRTVRDAIADLVITNAIIYAALIPVIGTSPSLTTFLVVEVLDEAANLAIARQIDGPAPEWSALSYDMVRDLYLAERERRCAEVRRE
jgi:phospholipid-binding lipoprotein MlaA